MRPLVVAVTGRIASGKSTIARRLADGLGATLLVGDRIRDGAVAELAREGAPLEARLRALERGFGDEVYAELLRRAAAELAAGRSVVLDAAFPRRALRGELRALATRAGAECRIVPCRAAAAAPGWASPAAPESIRLGSAPGVRKLDECETKRAKRSAR